MPLWFLLLNRLILDEFIVTFPTKFREDLRDERVGERCLAPNSALPGGDLLRHGLGCALFVAEFVSKIKGISEKQLIGRPRGVSLPASSPNYPL